VTHPGGADVDTNFARGGWVERHLLDAEVTWTVEYGCLDGAHTDRTRGLSIKPGETGDGSVADVATAVTVLLSTALGRTTVDRGVCVVTGRPKILYFLSNEQSIIFLVLAVVGFSVPRRGRHGSLE
jgi:hypothetical protein